MRAAILFILLVIGLAAYGPSSFAAEEDPAHEGDMSLDHMHTILERLDGDLKRDKGNWQLTVADMPIVIVTDASNNRMRILIAIRKADALTPKELTRMMQANFDSALDARYAIAQGLLWSTFIHPLSTLHDRQFIAAIGQTINLAQTYGSSYSSGLLVYGGGDSNAIELRELINKLLEQGQPT